jgi:hypothetical protein
MLYCFLNDREDPLVGIEMQPDHEQTASSMLNLRFSVLHDPHQLARRDSQRLQIVCSEVESNTDDGGDGVLGGATIPDESEDASRVVAGAKHVLVVIPPWWKRRAKVSREITTFSFRDLCRHLYSANQSKAVKL